MGIFVLSYTFWTIWTIIDLEIGDSIESMYVDILMGDLLVPGFCNFIPIFLVLYTHFKNITSLSRIVKLSFSKKQNEENSFENYFVSQ